MSLVDCIDSYYLWVQQQIAARGASAYVTINGQSIAQPFGGVIQARDWPPTPLVEGALYLLVLDATPRGGSVSQTFYEIVCQWNWLLIGTDVTDVVQGANRGDRYRANMQVMDNLRQGNFPGFCQKQSSSIDTSVPPTLIQTPVTTTFPYTQYELVYWNRVRFPIRQDKNSGIVYGVGAISLFAWDDVDASLAVALS